MCVCPWLCNSRNNHLWFDVRIWDFSQLWEHTRWTAGNKEMPSWTFHSIASLFWVQFVWEQCLCFNFLTICENELDKLLLKFASAFQKNLLTWLYFLFLAHRFLLQEWSLNLLKVFKCLFHYKISSKFLLFHYILCVNFFFNKQLQSFPYWDLRGS